MKKARKAGTVGKASTAAIQEHFKSKLPPLPAWQQGFGSADLCALHHARFSCFPYMKQHEDGSWWPDLFATETEARAYVAENKIPTGFAKGQRTAEGVTYWVIGVDKTALKAASHATGGVEETGPISIDEFVIAYPFETEAEAAAALNNGEQVDSKTLLFNDDFMSVPESGTPLERWRVITTPTEKPKPAAKKPPVAAGPTRKGIVRDLLLTGKPLALETLMEKWGCSKGAASALISDVRHMGYTVDKRPDGQFEIATK